MHVTSSSAVTLTDVFEITKVQTETENNILQHLDKFACCYKDLLVLMKAYRFCDVTTSKYLILEI